MDGEAGWWTTSGNIGLPPLARAMGVGRQQQGNGGEIEREGSEVDGARATGEEAGGVSQGEGGDPVVVVDDGEGLGEKGGKSWYDVDDRLDGKGTGGEKDQLGAVEEEGNGGG